MAARFFSRLIRGDGSTGATTEATTGVAGATEAAAGAAGAAGAPGAIATSGGSPGNSLLAVGVSSGGEHDEDSDEVLLEITDVTHGRANTAAITTKIIVGKTAGRNTDASTVSKASSDASASAGADATRPGDKATQDADSSFCLLPDQGFVSEPLDSQNPPLDNAHQNRQINTQDSLVAAKPPACSSPTTSLPVSPQASSVPSSPPSPSSSCSPSSPSLPALEALGSKEDQIDDTQTLGQTPAKSPFRTVTPTIAPTSSAPVAVPSTAAAAATAATVAAVTVITVDASDQTPEISPNLQALAHHHQTPPSTTTTITTTTTSRVRVSTNSLVFLDDPRASVSSSACSEISTFSSPPASTSSAYTATSASVCDTGDTASAATSPPSSDYLPSSPLASQSYSRPCSPFPRVTSASLAASTVSTSAPSSAARSRAYSSASFASISSLIDPAATASTTTAAATCATPAAAITAATATFADSTSKRSRYNKQELHAARVQRSASKSVSFGSSPPPGERRTSIQTRFKRSASSPAEALAAVEPPKEQGLTKMAFAEQQRWITVQQKTFTKWLNTKIEVRNLQVNDLVKDLSDGVVLIHLLECLSNESLGRYASKPKLRVQRFENANLSLDFIKSRGIQMTNIGAEDVVDGNRKIILGLIWTLILRFTINDINEEGMTAKEGLLLWCQRKTACYDEVDVRDFSASWNDGLAFCALLDIHRPDLIDYDSLDKSDHRGNMQLAFDIAHKEIGIPKLLDVEDVCDVAKPDERSLMTYIAYWFHAFSQMEKVENAGRRVEKFVLNMQGAWEMQSAYERRMAALLAALEGQKENWQTSKFEGTYADAKAQAAQFAAYKRGQKREWVAEKSELATLLGNIKTKLGTYRLRPYEPPRHLSLENMEIEWAKLSKAEMKRAQLINETIRDIKNALRKSFADKANDFAMALNAMQLAISGLEGDIEDQLELAKQLNLKIPPLDKYLETIQVVDTQCMEANIEENDFTTYTLDELVYELSLVKSSVQKKLAFLDNQMVARNMTNLTPIQLEEFESVFRHFDRTDSNSLTELEFSAALASLGLVFSEDEMHDYFVETSHGRDRVTFEQFIRFMVEVTEDQNSAEQVFQSFREVADGKPYITEMDLRHSLVPDEVIEKLTDIMPSHSGPDMQADRGMPQYDYISFMDKLMADVDDETYGEDSLLSGEGDTQDDDDSYESSRHSGQM
ncbi:Alpha-actinin-like protein 1 [Ceratocystis fimbriata CBS 114723]|uniref:Alpha-actinin-like protein 1 n=1 Tax=Ceratocystis fimbriata CBS 114723 TaxID=1035309 RepID=A0A2C5X1C3_9PEZI|nr:Alpha-actinin-like protein 1 [Ceratocystis fimbriata CBS 114723]